MIKINYDKKAKAFYIKLSDRSIARTIEIENGQLFIDLDEENHVVGLEIIGLTLPKKCWEGLKALDRK